MRTVPELIEAVHREAARAEFPVDAAVYAQHEKDPTRPILFAGSLDAPLCVFARDLGKDEVAAGQPLIGAGGRLVRAGIYEAKHGEPPPKSDRTLESVLEGVLLTNTVPFKPPGNKAYSAGVKERFRPFLAELLAEHWKGRIVVTLGTEAFEWFAPYADPAVFAAFWKRDDRYEAVLDSITLRAGGPDAKPKPLTLMPLPHPSPLNQKWYKRFPTLLARRLEVVAAR